MLLLLCNCAFPSLARRLARQAQKTSFSFCSPLPCVFCFCWCFFRFVSFRFLSFFNTFLLLFLLCCARKTSLNLFWFLFRFLGCLTLCDNKLHTHTRAHVYVYAEWQSRYNFQLVYGTEQLQQQR